MAIVLLAMVMMVVGGGGDTGVGVEVTGTEQRQNLKGLGPSGMEELVIRVILLLFFSLSQDEKVLGVVDQENEKGTGAPGGI